MNNITSEKQNIKSGPVKGKETPNTETDSAKLICLSSHTNLTDTKLKQVNELLANGEPDNVTIDDSRENQSYAGYKPQAVIDAMNHVFGFQYWGYDDIRTETITRKTSKGSGQLAICNVSVWILDPAFKRTAWGQNTVTRGDIGDAKKAAQTDAIKKALSLFSVGNRAYLGLLDQDKRVSRIIKKQTRERYESRQVKYNQQQPTPVVNQIPVVATQKIVNTTPEPQKPVVLPETCQVSGCNEKVDKNLAQMIYKKKGVVVCLKHAYTPSAQLKLQ